MAIRPVVVASPPGGGPLEIAPVPLTRRSLRLEVSETQFSGEG